MNKATSHRPDKAGSIEFTSNLGFRLHYREPVNDSTFAALAEVPGIQGVFPRVKDRTYQIDCRRANLHTDKEITTRLIEHGLLGELA